jgi:NADPH:quinone reductase-like Zn-dependent oxidoreductase
VKAAVVVEAGKTPVYADFKDPIPAEGEVLVNVRAAALSNLVKSRASGTHYSSTVTGPFVAGVDGVGTMDDGERVYFVFPRAPYGSMAEKTVVRSSLRVPVPADLGDVTAAAIANPGLASWAALKERAKLSSGESVLVNGATGTAGRLAVQVAKFLGARKVVAIGRNVEALKSVRALGADVTIPIGDAGDAFEDAVRGQFAGDGIDVVLDYLWGPTTERIILAAAKGGKDGVPIRFVSVGSMGGLNVTLPSGALRSTAITLLGSGIGSIPREKIVKSIGELFQATGPAGFQIETKSYPLSEVESVWPTAENRPRVVFLVS